MADPPLSRRVVISFLAFLVLPQVWLDLAQVSYRSMAVYSAVGIGICMHWVTFYISVKTADSVSITLTCMGTMAMFVSILEPFFLGVAFSLKDTLISLIVVCGIVQVYFSLPQQESTLDTGLNYKMAVCWGIFSTLLCAICSVVNKAFINQGSALAIATVEIGSAAALLTMTVPILYGDQTIWYPTLDFANMSWDTLRTGPFDLLWVMTLAVMGTNVCQYLGNKALNHLSAFTVNLIGILEPIYGIVLGAVFFHENKDLSVDFYYGAGIILFALVMNTIFTDSGSSHTPVVPTLEIGIIPAVGGAATPASPTSSGKYVSHLRKPKMSPGAALSARRPSRTYSDDIEDDEPLQRKALHNGVHAIPV